MASKTIMGTDAFIRYSERMIQRDRIRAMCEPDKEKTILKGIEMRKRILDAVNRNISNRKGVETCAFADSDSFTRMEKN